MRHDLHLITWLRLKQFQDSAIYWLRVLGYQSGEQTLSSRLYVVYLAGIGLIWVGAMGSWGFEQANTIGAFLPNTALIGLLQGIPIVVLLLQVYFMVTALRSTPLKLSFADMAYVAGAPINPAALVTLGFIRQSLIRSLILGSIGTLFAVILVRPLGSGLGGIAAVRACLIIIPLLILSQAFAWLLGTFRLINPRIRNWHNLWLLPLLLIILAYFVPEWILWPGRAVILQIYGIAPNWLLPLFIITAVALIGILVYLSQRINMIQAVDESILYARIQALGLLAWRQIDLQFRIRIQSAQAGRKPLLKLPKAYGFWTLMTRAALSYIRHPFMLMFSFLWGAAITQMAVLIITNSLPIQVWIAWLLAVGVAPPAGLLYVFRVDIEEQFLRQFLPVGGFQLLLADIILPLVFTVAGSLGIWLLQTFPPDITLYGLTMIPILTLLVALCGAVAMTTKRVLQTRILATILSFGVIIIAAVNLQSAAAAYGLTILAILILMGILENNS